MNLSTEQEGSGGSNSKCHYLGDKLLFIKRPVLTERTTDRPKGQGSPSEEGGGVGAVVGTNVVAAVAASSVFGWLSVCDPDPASIFSQRSRRCPAPRPRRSPNGSWGTSTETVHHRAAVLLVPSDGGMRSGRSLSVRPCIQRTISAAVGVRFTFI